MGLFFIKTTFITVFMKMQNLFLTFAHVSKMLCLNNWDVFHNPAEKDCSLDVDAAETVRFSWKVVEPQGQREHDVRVS